MSNLQQTTRTPAPSIPALVLARALSDALNSDECLVGLSVHATLTSGVPVGTEQVAGILTKHIQDLMRGDVSVSAESPYAFHHPGYLA